MGGIDRRAFGADGYRFQEPREFGDFVPRREIQETFGNKRRQILLHVRIWLFVESQFVALAKNRGDGIHQRNRNAWNFGFSFLHQHIEGSFAERPDFGREEMTTDSGKRC